MSAEYWISLSAVAAAGMGAEARSRPPAVPVVFPTERGIVHATLALHQVSTNQMRSEQQALITYI
jgi:hypothetical protein